MSNYFGAILILVIALIRLLAKNGTGKKKNDAANQTNVRAASAAPAPAARQQSAQQRSRAREQAQQERDRQWREAKARQDDAVQVHSVHMDSCENRLESLRVLYDAGILDREEFAERVARVKALHGRS